MNPKRATAATERGQGVTNTPSRVPELGRGSNRRTAARRFEMVAGVPLPADELAEALQQYEATRYLEGRKGRTDRREQFEGWRFAAAARACLDPEVSGSAHFPATAGQPGVEWITLNAWARRHGVAGSTARRWVSRDMLSGQRVGRDWLVEATARPPIRTRKPLTDKENQA